MYSYQHSEVFGKLKTTHEDISGNYTTPQYLQTLDYFLWRALEPVVQACPTLFKNYLAKILCRQSLRPSSKLTSNERQQLPSRVFSVLVARDADSLLAAAKELHLNRGLLFGLIGMFLSRLSNYRRLMRSNTPLILRKTLLATIERDLGVVAGTDLYAVAAEVEYWDRQAREFKEKILEKYTRLALNHAQGTYKKLGYSVLLDDVIQVYMNVVNKAINRCDSRQGVLTTFITSWFKSAKGEAAKLADGSNMQSYEGLQEVHGDSAHMILGSVDPNTDFELQQHAAYIAKRVDPEGLVRTSLGIPQFITSHHEATLLKYCK